jgi:hypothetical protein
MRAIYYLGAVIALGVTFGPGIETPSGLSGIAGVSPAQARVYTRKRVRGRWITGHFSSRSIRHASRFRRVVIRERDDDIEPPPQPTPRPRELATTPPPDRKVAAATPIAPVAPVVSEEERRTQLQKALEARAEQLAFANAVSTTGSLPGAAAASDSTAVRAPTQPRSVSFDFESGLKTTTFQDNIVVREGFDTSAARTLAATPPTASTLPSVKPAAR